MWNFFELSRHSLTHWRGGEENNNNLFSLKEEGVRRENIIMLFERNNEKFQHSNWHSWAVATACWARHGTGHWAGQTEERNSLHCGISISVISVIEFGFNVIEAEAKERKFSSNCSVLITNCGRSRGRKLHLSALSCWAFELFWKMFLKPQRNLKTSHFWKKFRVKKLNLLENLSNFSRFWLFERNFWLLILNFWNFCLKFSNRFFSLSNRFFLFLNFWILK